MNMIEQVARAMARSCCIRMDLTSEEAQAEVDREWPNWALMARLAIKAMREPTALMAKSGNNMLPGGIMWTPHGMKMAERAYQAMIDAALEEVE